MFSRSGAWIACLLRPGRCITMNPISIFMLGMAMSTDAFAAALGKGAGMLKPRFNEALRIGFIFGFVEMLTPIIGWFLGSAAARYIDSIDHWVAFILLAGLGCHMIYGSFQDEPQEKETSRKNGIFSIALTGLATSIDALAVGVGLALIDVNIVLVAIVIGLCTWTMVTICRKTCGNDRRLCTDCRGHQYSLRTYRFFPWLVRLPSSCQAHARYCTHLHGNGSDYLSDFGKNDFKISYILYKNF